MNDWFDILMKLILPESIEVFGINIIQEKG
jgi:hypothetical protein